MNLVKMIERLGDPSEWEHKRIAPLSIIISFEEGQAIPIFVCCICGAGPITDHPEVNRCCDEMKERQEQLRHREK